MGEIYGESIFFSRRSSGLYNPEHPSITPCQHIVRSAAGPVFNLSVLLASLFWRRAVPAGSPDREVADIAVGMNALITGAALTPIPEFDGGPIAKWSLISLGCSPAQAISTLHKANRLIGSVLAGAAVVGAVRRRRLAALLMALLGGLALADGFKK